MKSIKGFALGLAFGIAVAISTVALAQTTKPTDQTPKGESCCTLTCCCHGDSCAMHTAEMKHEQGQMKRSEGTMKAYTGEGSCCCCNGSDSCEMQMKVNEKDKQKRE